MLLDSRKAGWTDQSYVGLGFCGLDEDGNIEYGTIHNVKPPVIR